MFPFLLFIRDTYLKSLKFTLLFLFMNVSRVNFNEFFLRSKVQFNHFYITNCVMQIM